MSSCVQEIQTKKKKSNAIKVGFIGPLLGTTGHDGQRIWTSEEKNLHLCVSYGFFLTCK